MKLGNSLPSSSQGVLIVGGGALATKGLGILLLFKIPVLLPAGLLGLYISFKNKEKNKEKLKRNLSKTMNKIESGLKEMEPKLEKMFVEIKKDYLKQKLISTNY